MCMAVYELLTACIGAGIDRVGNPETRVFDAMSI